MKIEDSEVIFSSGKRMYANMGIIGLSPKLDVTEGYDGSFWGEYEKEYAEDEERLSEADLMELADYMISQWQAFRAAVGKEPSR